MLVNLPRLGTITRSFVLTLLSGEYGQAAYSDTTNPGRDGHDGHHVESFPRIGRRLTGLEERRSALL